MISEITEKYEYMSDLERDSYSNAKMNLTRRINPMAREFYEKEVKEIEEKVKERMLELTR